MASAQRLQERISAAIEAELRRFGLELERAVVKYLDDNEVNVTGTLRKRVTSEVKRVADSIRLTVGVKLRYAIFVHEGTKPHWAPLDPLKRWVKKKLGISEPAQIEDVARRVQFKIAREGTEAQPFLMVPFELYRNKLASQIAEGLRREFAA
ncbi:MAG: hypothetical protein GVY18_05260 [Bacteroidetes bacterium]|jgi:hypothetical protein|nr:hypothetical protein [Bacteroidota bacterium]